MFSMFKLGTCDKDLPGVPWNVLRVRIQLYCWLTERHKDCGMLPNPATHALMSIRGWDVAQLVTASDRHTADAGSICLVARDFSQKINFQCRLSYGVWMPQCTVACINICAQVKDPCQSLADYGNTKTASIHPWLGGAILLKLAFPGEGNPNFPWENSHWDNTVVKKKKTVHQIKPSNKTGKTWNWAELSVFLLLCWQQSET